MPMMLFRCQWKPAPGRPRQKLLGAVAAGFLAGSGLATQAGAADLELPLTVAVLADEMGGQGPEKLDFDGLGLDIGAGRSEVARALRSAPPVHPEDEMIDLLPDIVVTGPPPSQAGAGFMAAEMARRIGWIDLGAGVIADKDVAFEGPAAWTSRLGMTLEDPSGTGRLAVRTRMEQRQTTRVLGVEVGPQFERSLGSGVTLFLNGKAEAVSRFAIPTEPTTTGRLLSGGENLIGVIGQVGIAR
jgi:hypothetical protein